MPIVLPGDDSGRSSNGLNTQTVANSSGVLGALDSGVQPQEGEANASANGSSGPAPGEVPQPDPDVPALMKNDPSWEGGSHTRGNFMKGVIVKDAKGKLSYYTFQFNPTEMGGQNQANWKLYTGPGSLLPIASFLHMNAPTMDLELFVDCTDISKRRAGDGSGPLKVNGEFIGVWADIMAAITFLNPNVQQQTFDVKGRFCSPSPVILAMGPVVTRSVLTSVDWKITQWFQDLVPSRATIKLSFSGIASSFQGDFDVLQKNQKGLETSGLVKTAADASGLASVQKFLNYYGPDKFFVAK